MVEVKIEVAVKTTVPKAVTRSHFSGADQAIQATKGIRGGIGTAVEWNSRSAKEDLIEDLDRIGQIYLSSVIHVAGILTLELPGGAK